jgi:hypothetical protein
MALGWTRDDYAPQITEVCYAFLLNVIKKRCLPLNGTSSSASEDGPPPFTRGWDS